VNRDSSAKGSLESALHICSALKPISRVGAERALDRLAQLAGQIGTHNSEAPNFSTPTRARQFRDGVNANRVGLGREVEKQYTQTVNIAGDGRGAIAQHLRRQIQRGPGQGAARGGGTGRFRCGSEIDEDDATAVLADDILGFDVAVNQTGAVDGIKSGTQISPDASHLEGVERTFIAQYLVERPTVEEFHPQTCATAFDRRAIQFDDATMSNRRKTGGLLQESCIQFMTRTGGVRQFERDVHVQP
jgi:hypothetical protein